MLQFHLRAWLLGFLCVFLGQHSRSLTRFLSGQTIIISLLIILNILSLVYYP